MNEKHRVHDRRPDRRSRLGVTAAVFGFRNVFWVCAVLSLVAMLLLAGRRVFQQPSGGIGSRNSSRFPFGSSV